MTITLTTTQNQKNNINDNMTSIDLGECENIIRIHYNLTNNETLYIKKIDINQDGMNIPKIKYDIYSRTTEGKLEKLNITLCQDAKIFLLIPKEININYDILNSSSGYYNDICYTTTSDSGTDIPLSDRKNEYVNNTVCQDDCDFTYYDKNSKKVNCSCKAKESSKSYANMTIDKSNLLKDFINIKNIANINFLVCYKKLFNKNGITHNVGSYIILFIIWNS